MNADFLVPPLEIVTEKHLNAGWNPHRHHHHHNHHHHHHHRRLESTPALSSAGLSARKGIFLHHPTLPHLIYYRVILIQIKSELFNGFPARFKFDVWSNDVTLANRFFISILCQRNRWKDGRKIVESERSERE